MDVRVREIAERLDGLVTWSALRAAGIPEGSLGALVAGLRRLHDGVFLTGHGRITPHQRHLAATLTAPGTVLSHASAGAAWGLRPWTGRFVVVTRPGSGGPRRGDGLLVCRSTTLDGQATELDGVAITTAARTLIDLSAHLDQKQRDKAVREAIRIGATDADAVARAAREHRGRRGTRGLEALADRLAALPLGRTRSDAEARALEILGQAGVGPPRVNVRVAGLECDLAWPERRLIVEVDGRQFHRDPLVDQERDRTWTAAGWQVERIDSDVVFASPERLVAVALRGEPRPARPTVNVHGR